MRFIVALFAALFLAFSAGAAEPQTRKLPPVDEAAGDASWVRFKKRLLEAVEKRDKQFVLSILDKNVRNQDETTRGVAHFRQQWELDTEDSPLWRELAQALQLGGAFIQREKRPREFCAPYLLGRWPPEVTPFDHGVVIARDAQVQGGPSHASAPVGRLSYDIVEVADWEVDDSTPASKQKWVKVRLGKREGFIPEEQIRSPIEQAACFAKSGGAWRMTGFAPAGGE